MTDDFKYDVFFSHSVKDKEIVLPIAERLRADGVHVWFEGWEINSLTTKPRRLKKIEDGLECSRVLVLCISTNTFGSDWAQLEASTLRFRDPLSKERRFIPLHLDETPAKGFLASLIHISWSWSDRESAYAKLLEVCRQPRVLPRVDVKTAYLEIAERNFRLPLEEESFTLTFSPDGKLALSGTQDGAIMLWDVKTERCLKILEGHTGIVWSLGIQREPVGGT